MLLLIAGICDPGINTGRRYIGNYLHLHGRRWQHGGGCLWRIGQQWCQHFVLLTQQRWLLVWPLGRPTFIRLIRRTLPAKVIALESQQLNQLLIPNLLISMIVLLRCILLGIQFLIQFTSCKHLSSHKYNSYYSKSLAMVLTFCSWRSNSLGTRFPRDSGSSSSLLSLSSCEDNKVIFE